MVIKLRNDNDSIMFINEEKIKAVHFVNTGAGPYPYRIRIHAEQMRLAEYFFENEELYNNALETFCEYEKFKISQNHIIGIDLAK